MRVVLDTNVLMSGIFFAGPPATILAAWAEGELELLASVDILTEYRRVGSRLGSSRLGSSTSERPHHYVSVRHGLVIDGARAIREKTECLRRVSASLTVGFDSHRLHQTSAMIAAG
jgi:hypothetical protein